MSATAPARNPVKPVRKDSARNRELLLAAARTVFAERGLDATLDDVAQAAGVGVGTAYRHFANKQELAAEVMQQSSQNLVDDARTALLVADPWQALVGFFDASAARLVQDRGLHQALFGPTPHEKSPLRHDLIDAVVELFARARAAGVIRPDVEATDGVPIYSMMKVAFDVSSAIDPELWRRYLALFLDGLRATDRGPLPGSAIPLSRLDEALAATKPSKR
jgi:AcrR family transcriptional regulator